MGREFIDNAGGLWEIVWAGDMRVSLTGPRPMRPVESQLEAKDSSPRRIYNKTGRHSKDKDCWVKPEVNKFGMSLE